MEYLNPYRWSRRQQERDAGYGKTTEQQKAVGALFCDYAEHRQPFDEMRHRQTLGEVSDVADDWKIQGMMRRAAVLAGRPRPYVQA